MVMRVRMRNTWKYGTDELFSPLPGTGSWEWIGLAYMQTCNTIDTLLSKTTAFSSLAPLCFFPPCPCPLSVTLDRRPLGLSGAQPPANAAHARRLDPETFMHVVHATPSGPPSALADHRRPRRFPCWALVMPLNTVGAVKSLWYSLTSQADWHLQYSFYDDLLTLPM